ncbi:MAG: methyltransferase domain-containing protein [Candidatus Lokiarchaeota archaeon]|nr:methyltransferase domain-containing protein [Candidatus Lokiarchaeota archaeon]MBD3337784.1 methyltransferase domain-containing protein [Candidatus Lokiarchaeota archaeon]
MWYENLINKGLIPERIIRLILRLRFKYRLGKEYKNIEARQEHINDFVDNLKKQPIAIKTIEANLQHYEVPSSFFAKILGHHMKYSCGYWKNDVKKRNYWKYLDQSEEEMLDLTLQRAQVKDEQNILELGCGWGSLSLYAAKRFSNTNITAITNSKTQKSYVEHLKKERNLTNLKVIKADIQDFDIEEKFDRIISIEMFEHMRNYEQLFTKLYHFLKKKGKLFVHIFTHDGDPYLFETGGDSDWMTKNFFSGGTMLSKDLLIYFAKDFHIERIWRVSGRNYSKTLEAWLQNMKRNKKTIFPLLKEKFSKKNAKKYWNYWKIFFIACSEVFNYNKGNVRFVSHYLFEKR